MKPAEWLRNTQVVKARNKYPSWSGDDFVRYAHNMFGSDEMSTTQLVDFCESLKGGTAERPSRVPGMLTGAPVTAAEDRGFSVEDLVMVANPGQANANHSATHWYRVGARAELRFDCARDLTAWALGLLAGDFARLGWRSALDEWRRSNHLDIFKPAAHPYLVCPQLQAHLTRKARKLARLSLPLPDNATIAKRYWSLAQGDRLVNPETGESAVVVESRPTLEGPPALVLRKATENVLTP